MTDRITATRAVIEAANALRQAEDAYEDSAGDGEAEAISRSQAFFGLRDALDALASAASPDLDAKIAEVLPCDGDCSEPNYGEHDAYCSAARRPAVRDLIVALLAIQGDQLGAIIRMTIMDGRAQRQVGFEQAREQAAEIIRAMEP